MSESLGRYLVPGFAMRVAVKNPPSVISCFLAKKIRSLPRRPYKNSQKQKVKQHFRFSLFRNKSLYLPSPSSFRTTIVLSFGEHIHRFRTSMLVSAGSSGDKLFRCISGDLSRIVPLSTRLLQSKFSYSRLFWHSLRPSLPLFPDNP